MKKVLALTLTLALAAALAACSSAPASSSAAASVASSSKAASSAANSEVSSASVEYTEAQAATIKGFSDMCDRFNALADTINADEALSSITELTTTMTEVGDAINEVDKLFADPANLTDDVLPEIDSAVVDCNTFLDEVDSMVAVYAGKALINATIEIVNDTGVDIHMLSMSPANDDAWGGDLLSEPLATGTSGTTEMTFTEDTLVWDLMAADAEGNTLTFMGIDFTEAPVEGAQLILTVEGEDYIAKLA